jgi:hypothetical protein
VLHYFSLKILTFLSSCEHYSFVSSFEPFKVEDALRDPDWVVAMQEELNKIVVDPKKFVLPSPLWEFDCGSQTRSW